MKKLTLDVMDRVYNFSCNGDRFEATDKDSGFVAYKGSSFLYRDLGDGYLYHEDGYIDPSNNIESFKIHLMEHINRWIEANQTF